MKNGRTVSIRGRKVSSWTVRAEYFKPESLPGAGMGTVRVSHYFGAAEKSARAFMEILPQCSNVRMFDLVEKKRVITSFTLPPRRGVS